MRLVQARQLQLGEFDIASIQLDLHSHDDIPQLLRGVQYVYENTTLREKVFAILEKLNRRRASLVYAGALCWS